MEARDLPLWRKGRKVEGAVFTEFSLAGLLLGKKIISSSCWGVLSKLLPIRECKVHCIPFQGFLTPL